MEKEIKDLLGNLLDTIYQVEENIQGLGYEDWSNDRKKKIAVIDLLGIVFTLYDTIPAVFRDSFIAVNWDEMVEFRQRFLNTKEEIDDEAIWHDLKHKLKKFEKSIFRILKDNK